MLHFGRFFAMITEEKAAAQDFSLGRYGELWERSVSSVRTLFWFAVGFAGACLAVAAWCWNQAACLCLAAGGLCLLLAVLCQFQPVCRQACVLALGLCLGSGWFFAQQQVYYAPLYALDGQVLSLNLCMEEYPQQGNYGMMAQGSLRLEGKLYPVRVYLKEDMPLPPGSTLQGDFLVRLTLPGGQKESDYAVSSHYFATATQKGELQVGVGTGGYFPQRFAANVKKMLALCLPEAEAQFAQSLLLGDSTGLDYETKSALTVSGIRHIIAVSGLHVGVLYGMLRWLFRRQRGLMALAGIPALYLFAAMVGFSPSVCRACIMVGMLLLADLVQRERDSLTSLAASVVVLLVYNPFMILSTGFQLSVLSVLGILLFQRRLQEAMLSKMGKMGKHRLLGSLAASVSVTLSAMSLSTPLSAWYFGSVSLVGLLTNLVALPMVGVIFYGVVAVAALGLCWLPGGQMLGSVVAVLIRLLTGCASCLAGLPVAAVYTCGWGIWFWLAGCYLLLAAYGLFHRGKFRWYILACGVSLAVCLGGSAWLPRQDDCRMTVLDVGQGQCILLQSGGESFLVDCGSYSAEAAADAAAAWLSSQLVLRLDGLAVTHYDSDHAGGVEFLLSRVDTRRLVLPGEDRQPLAEEEERLLVCRDTTIPFGRGRLRFFPYTGRNSTHENSMAILFETKNCAILITGDWDRVAEKLLLGRYDFSDTDVLIAGHHGSKHSTSQELLEGTRPDTVVISVGRNNSYGHPAEQVLQRLEEAGCQVYRTDQLGTIIIRR